MICQLLLQDDSGIENSSGSGTEDHLETDPAYETDGEDEVSALTQQQLSGQDSQIRSSDAISC